MNKRREPRKPKVLWVRSTPITPIFAEGSRNIRKRIHKRREKLRQRYPKVHSRAVDSMTINNAKGL